MKRILIFGVPMLLFTMALHGQSSPAQDAREKQAPDQASAPTPPTFLDSLVQEALQKNPGVQSTLLQVQALRHRVPQAKTLPDPTVSVGWMGNITPFSVQKGDPSSYRGVGAMQEIPFPGKLKLRGEIADREAEAAWWDYEAARRNLTADVKAAYYDYFAAFKAVEITKKDKDLLQKLSSIAEARYRVGKGVQQDVLKSQTEISLLEQRLTVFEQQERTAQARLNTLLFRDPETPLAAPEKVEQLEDGREVHFRSCAPRRDRGDVDSTYASHQNSNCSRRMDYNTGSRSLHQCKLSLSPEGHS